MTEMIEPGRSIAGGKYKILEFIGEGGFGLVYETLHQPLNKKVAIKLLKEDKRGDEQILDLFKNEAQMIAHLEHENIVRIYDFFEHDFYYVMSRLYRPLDRELRSVRRFSFPRALGISLDISKALEFLSVKGIVHRDMKPANIMSAGEEKGKAVLTDFSIAVKVDPSAPRPAGTPPYASPEQIAGEPLDHRSDMYSFGVVLYELLTGQLPFAGRTFDEIREKHKAEEVTPPSMIVGRKNEKFEGIILKLLKLDREKRYQSISLLKEELNEVKFQYRANILEFAKRNESEGRIISAINELDAYLDDVDASDTEIIRLKSRIQKRQHVSDAEHALRRGALDKATEGIEIACSNGTTDVELEEKLYDVRADIQKAKELTEDAKKLVETRRYEEAKKKYRNLQEIETDNVAIKQYADACDWLAIAGDRMKEKEYQHALDYYNKAGAVFPDIRFIAEEIGKIQATIREYEKRYEEHIERIVEHTQNLPISKLKSEMETLREKEVICSSVTHDKLLEIYSRIHFNIAKILSEQKNPDYERIIRELRDALNDHPDFPEAKKVLASVEVQAGHYQAAKSTYEDLTKTDDTFYTYARLMTNLDAIRKKSSNPDSYDEVRSTLDEVSKIIEDEQSLHGEEELKLHTKVIGEEIRKLRKQVEAKPTPPEPQPPPGPSPEPPTVPPTVASPSPKSKPEPEPTKLVPSIKEVRRKKAVMKYGFTFLGVILAVVIIVLVLSPFHSKPPVPQVSEAYHNAFAKDSMAVIALAGNTDTEERVDAMIGVWKDFLDRYPSSAWTENARGKLNFWLSEEAFQNARTIHEIDDTTDEGKRETWQRFIKEWSAVLGDSLSNQRIAAAKQYIDELKHTMDTSLDTPVVEAVEEPVVQVEDVEREPSSGQRDDDRRREVERDVYSAAQGIDRNPNRSHQDKIQTWGSFIERYPSSAYVSEAEERIRFWRSEKAFDDTYTTDRSEALTRERKIAAWREFIAHYPESNRVREAEERRDYWEMVFQEDFDNNDHGWPQNKSRDVLNYTDLGDYTIFYSTTSRLTSYDNAKDYEDFELRTSVKYSSGDDTKMYGVAFRIRDQGNFYIFGISGDGRYAIKKKIDYDSYSISSGQSDAIIRESGAANLLRLVVDGHRFEFYVNGVMVAGREDESIHSGRIGFYVDPGVMVHFDYVSVIPLTH